MTTKIASLYLAKKQDSFIWGISRKIKEDSYLKNLQNNYYYRFFINFKQPPFYTLTKKL